MFSSCTYGINFKILQHLVPELFANLGVHTTNPAHPPFMAEGLNVLNRSFGPQLPLCTQKKRKNLNEEEKPPQTVDMSTHTTFTLKKFTIYKLRHIAITLRQEKDGFKQRCWSHSRVP